MYIRKESGPEHSGFHVADKWSAIVARWCRRWLTPACIYCNFLAGHRASSSKSICPCQPLTTPSIPFHSRHSCSQTKQTDQNPTRNVGGEVCHSQYMSRGNDKREWVSIPYNPREWSALHHRWPVAKNARWCHTLHQNYGFNMAAR